MGDDDATRMLLQATSGDRQAADALIPLVYEELRALAGRAMNREPSDHTLQPTAIAHEAFLRLIEQNRVDWKGRAHFFAVAAEMVRRVLIDHARHRGRQKRGADRRREPLRAALEEAAADESVDILALHEALEELAKLDPRQARVVELRFFGGLTVEEVAHVTAVSPRTVKADWAVARAWLQGRLSR